MTTTPTPTSTFDRLAALLARDYQVPAERLTPDAPLESLGIDSLGAAELLFNIEDEFKVKVSAEPVALPTVGDVVSYIDGLIAARQGGAGGAGSTSGAGGAGSAESPGNAGGTGGPGGAGSSGNAGSVGATGGSPGAAAAPPLADAP